MRTLALMLGLFLSACAAVGGGVSGPEVWQEAEVEAASQRLLWQVTAIALEDEDFPVGTGMDPSSQVATTGWRMDLAPFKGEGFREQAQVRYEPLGPGHFKVLVRVARETNEELAKPMDPSYARWKKAPDDPVRAQIIIQRIKAWMGSELDVGEGEG